MGSKRRQETKGKGGWLNRYDFPCAGWGTVNTGLNTLKRVPPEFIQNAMKQVDLIK